MALTPLIGRRVGLKALFETYVKAFKPLFFPSCLLYGGGREGNVFFRRSVGGG